jgi:hypothetical protein
VLIKRLTEKDGLYLLDSKADKARWLKGHVNRSSIAQIVALLPSNRKIPVEGDD